MANEIKVNDIVRFLNDVGGGRVSRIEGKTCYVEDEDGFEHPTPMSMLVVVGKKPTTAQVQQSAYDRPIEYKSKLVEPDKPSKPKAVIDEPVYETPEGEQLNIMLAFEPRAIKHLSTTTFFATLVNDSNYFLDLTFMTRGDDTDLWQARYHGTVEPNFQIQLCEFGQEDLKDMTHIAVQYVARKQGKEFKLKNPALVNMRFNVTRFFKLHAFQPNEYFDTPVLAVEITRNDLPAKQQRIDSREIERAMMGGNRNADKQHSKPHANSAKRQRNDIIVQDLHIAELLDNLNGLSKGEMLNYQLNKFREIMNENRNNLGQRIVFIHGKGEGVLRRAILDELKQKYPACEAQDASFQEYGFGATQVTIHKNND